MCTSPMLYDSVTSPWRQNQAKWAAEGNRPDNFETRVDRGLNRTNRLCIYTNIYIHIFTVQYIYTFMRMSLDDNH